LGESQAREKRGGCNEDLHCEEACVVDLTLSVDALSNATLKNAAKVEITVGTMVSVKVMLQGEGMEMFVERKLYVRWAAGRCFRLILAFILFSR